MDLIGQGVTYARAKELYQKGLQKVNDISDMELSEFISWQEVQERFGLNENEEGA